MPARDSKDIFGGTLLALFGAATLIYTLQNYELGSLRRMGTGLFPASLATILVVFGIMQAGLAFLRSGARPEIRIREPLFILTGLAIFALTIRRFGVFPAVIGVTMVSSLADRDVNFAGSAVLAAYLCLLSWLIFRVALGLNLAMLNWPF